MRIAVLVKQIPRGETLELLPSGRLMREGVELEMNAYCRRAVSKGVELAKQGGGTCTVLTLGPPSAEDCLREAVAWGADAGVLVTGVLVTDPQLAGSDTLATARALASALKKEGPFDLVLVGRNSLDADTGQVPPEVAELLDLPFVAGARELHIEPGDAHGSTPAKSTPAKSTPAKSTPAKSTPAKSTPAKSTPAKATVLCELDDGWRSVRLALPAVVSTAERLCEPAKVDPEGRAAVSADRIRRLSAADLGPGPFGEAGSPTSVGQVRVMEQTRRRLKLSGGTLDEQVARAVSLLGEWGAIEGAGAERTSRGLDAQRVAEPSRRSGSGADDEPGPVLAVVTEPGRERLARELLGEAAQLARSVSGRVVAIGPGEWTPEQLDSWGADEVVVLRGSRTEGSRTEGSCTEGSRTEGSCTEGSCTEEDVAGALAGWCRTAVPWGVLVPGTLWGREVAARCAARVGAGLTGDAVGLGHQDGRLIAWKPAFGGRLVAAIHCSSDVQMATVRPGVLTLRAPRNPGGRVTAEAPSIEIKPRGRVELIEEGRDDDVETLLVARTLVAVGAAVPPDSYDDLQPLLKVLGAELAGTRKVTDKGWLPRSRQVGITGHSVAPALYVAIGIQGKFNHVIGTRSAGTVLALNMDPDAPIFDWADVGIVCDWREAVPALYAELERYRGWPDSRRY